MNFFIDQILKKLMTNFSNKSKTHILDPFLAHFPHFWDTILKNIRLCHAQHTGL